MALKATACSVPKPGGKFSPEKLIDMSETILLIELDKKEEVSYGIKYYLKSIEAIKGEIREVIEFYGYTETHEPSTYNEHNNPVFWFMDVGRSEWPCCICGPEVRAS